MVLTYAWLFWVVGGLLGASGLLAIAVWMRGDRSRGRKRCPSCWYDMSGAPKLVCPECGRNAVSEKRLLRTRRWKRWGAIGGALLVLGCSAAVSPRIAARGWMGAIPTTMLAAGALVYETSDATVFESLGSRELSRWQRWAWCRRGARILGDADVAATQVAPLGYWTRGPTVSLWERTLFSIRKSGASAAPMGSMLADAIARAKIRGHRCALVEMLGELGRGDVRATRALVKLAESDADAHVREAAVRELGRSHLDVGAATDALRRVCESERSRSVRWEAIRGLGSFGGGAGADAAGLLTRMLKDNDEIVRDAAVIAWIQVRGAHSAADLEAGLEASPMPVRDVIRAYMTGREHDTPCVHTLAPLMRSEEAEARSWAALAIAAIGTDDEAQLPAIQMRWRIEESGRARCALLAAISEMERTSGGAYIDNVGAIDDTDSRVRLLGCYGLRTTANAWAQVPPALQAATADPDGEVRAEATATIEVLSW